MFYHVSKLAALVAEAVLARLSLQKIPLRIHLLAKKIALAAVSSLILAATSVAADISANLALTTDYKFRGISQSDESVALQGGFDYEHASGFYLGTWGSSVDFDTDGGGYDGSLELDVYAGFSNSFGASDWGYDLSILYYSYPGDDDEEGDYLELYGALSWKDLSLSVAYANDYYAETGKFYYVAGDYEHALPQDFTLLLHAGYNSLDEVGFLSNGADDYWDYTIGITKSVAGIDLSLAYTGTDLDEDEVFDTRWGKAQAIFTVSKSL